MKRMICGILSATLILASVPAHAAVENATLLTESAVQNHFREAIDHAVTAVASQPVDAAEVLQSAQAPRRLVEQAAPAASGSGGHLKLVMTLVTTAAGIVGTVYAMKMAKKQLGALGSLGLGSLGK
jgi:hypothetical protein